MNNRELNFTRRHFIRYAAGSTLWLSLKDNAVAKVATPIDKVDGLSIRHVRVGKPTGLSNNRGDTWAVAWGDDGHLYVPSNDGPGFYGSEFHAVDTKSVLTPEQRRQFESDPEGAVKTVTADQLKQMDRLETNPMHIVFNRLTGNDPLNLTGESITRLPDFNAVDCAERDPLPFWLAGPDGRTWKSSGCISVDGTLYWAISRHNYGNVWGRTCTRQSAVNASIIMSVDYGKTWMRSAKDNYETPMFSGSFFATPYFIDYGKSQVAAHGADRYIYAISNNGYWDNGDTLVLGRVLRDRIGRLNGADWEFFTGGVHGDGMDNANWVGNAALATPILGAPGEFGETAAAYLPARQRYLMISWYFPACSGHVKGASKTSVWDFYEALTPWGPWTRIGTHTWLTEGFYCPVICPRFQSDSRVFAFTAGFPGKEVYRLTIVPIDLE
jgi:hypothetical protein